MRGEREVFMRAHLGVLLGALTCAAALPAHAQTTRPPLVLQEDGSFFAGGAKTQVLHTGTNPDGSPAPSGTAFIGHAYVQYRIPAERNAIKVPLVLMHGGRHSGATYETTPDGREGWANYFVRRGFATYVVDAPGAGRSGFNGEAINKARVEAKPEIAPSIGIATAEAAWANFRFGAKYPETYPGTQFPVSTLDAYYPQWVPSVGGTAAIAQWAPGLISVLDRLGPSILMTHSASGGPGWQTALQRPDKVRAVVAIEPGNCTVADADLPKFKSIAVLVVFGDYTEGSTWADRVVACRAFVQKLSAAGGTAKFLLLPEAGLKGNSHMMMMDKNSDDVAGLVNEWLIAAVK